MRRTRTGVRKIDLTNINEMSDDKNPKYIFQMTDTALLLNIAKDEIDPVKLAKDELANRGLDSQGKWIGFDRAKRFWDHIYYRNGKGITVPED